MKLKVLFIASGIVVLALLAASNAPALARRALPRGAETSLGAPRYSTSIEGSTGPGNTSQNDERRLSPGPILGLICAIAASALALGVAFGLRRRIERIGGPDPDKEDDNY